MNVRQEDKEYKFRLDCECGHCSLVAQYFPELITIPEENVIYIHYEMCIDYAAKGLLKTFIERVKIAWYALTGKPYVFFDIGVRKYQLEDFKKFIEKAIKEC